MSTHPNETTNCPSCGQPLPTGALAGLCPVCLLAQGAETEPGGTQGRVRFEPPSLATIAGLFPQLEVIALLGAGGMGAVYQARQPALDRRVALKVLPAGGGVGSAERFNREARALARLSHPNIVAVHEFGQVEGLHYFIMEFVDGTNLRQLEKASRLSAREALQIIPQICDALQYAHDEGVVHRDIKPENVLVDRKGRVKIADFGLAKIVDPDPEAARLTVEGQVMGTPHYMAPEQVERPLAVDHRADIYALGVVFYEMLTGDLPLGKFPPPSRKVQVDVRLDDIVLRALENDPDRRYQHASDVKSEVQTLSGEETASVGKSSKGVAGKHVAQWGGVFAMWTLGLALLATSLGGLLMASLGVVGIHATIYRSVAGALLIAFGVLRSLKILNSSRPTPGSAAIGWKEQVIRFIPLAAAGVLAVIASGFVGNFASWALSRSSGDEISVAQLAEHQSDTGTLRAELPGGGIVELLAVGDAGAAPNQWWRPDGTLETEFTYEIDNPIENRTTGRVSKDLLFRIVDLPQGAGRYGLSSGFTTGASSGGRVLRSGQLLPGVVQFRTGFPPEAREDDFDMAFGLEPWHTIASQQAHSQSSKQERRLDELNWQVLFHLPTRNELGEAQISAVVTGEDRRWTYQVVAVDTNGVEHAATSSQGTPFENNMLWTCTFGGLPIAQTREFQFQVRPLHRVRFANVQLQPKTPLPPATILKFGDAIELSFDELFDLDSGRTGSFPAGSARSAEAGSALSLVKDIGDNLTWMQEQGFDLEARYGAIGLLGVRVAELQAEDWNLMTPATLEARLREEGRMPTELPVTSDRLTLGFRTREGITGIMQLVSADATQPLVHLRRKLVGAPHSQPVLEAPPQFSAEAITAKPQLRFLAWQDQWEAKGIDSVHHVDGSEVNSESKLAAAIFRQARPTLCEAGGTADAGSTPRFLHLWFGHPAFDRQSLTAIELTDARGEPLKPGAGGLMGSNVLPADRKSSEFGWLMITRSPTDGPPPTSIGVELKYAVGLLENTRVVEPTFSGGFTLEGGSQLSAIGSDQDGKSFVALAVDTRQLGARQFGVIAVARDGREITQSGGGSSGPSSGGLWVQRYEFDLPLSEVKHFKIGTRPVRTATWKDVILPPLVN